jgi:hypothetical protein
MGSGSGGYMQGISGAVGLAIGLFVVFGALGERGWVDSVLKSGDTIRSRVWKGPFTTRLEPDTQDGKMQIALYSQHLTPTVRLLCPTASDHRRC